MPTYEYECDGCGHRFERFQSITAAPVKTCPECGARRVNRLLGTGAALLFKGSGFYATDYRKGSPPEGSKGEGEKSGSSEGGKDAGSPGPKSSGKADSE